jgi:hypothetical protein
LTLSVSSSGPGAGHSRGTPRLAFALARPEGRPGQRGADSQVEMSVAKFWRSLLQICQLACVLPQQGPTARLCSGVTAPLVNDSHDFLLLLSGRDRRGLLAERSSAFGAGCIACDRNVRGEVLRSSHLRPQRRRMCSSRHEKDARNRGLPAKQRNRSEMEKKRLTPRARPVLQGELG